ncbi:MAG: speF [Rickettsiaceae bacterium]|nr:speF [Rickettsiaceae bacterium]
MLLNLERIVFTKLLFFVGEIYIFIHLFFWDKSQEMEYDGALKSNIRYLNFQNGRSKSSNPLSRSHQYSYIETEIAKVKPSVPVYAVRPNSIKKAAGWFLTNFSGKVLYSVKSNPDKAALTHLYNAGVEHFDVASLKEVKLIAELFPQAKMYFMHPIKSREAIHEAYFNHNIRDFSLDSISELEKILQVTNMAKDLALHVRLAIPNSHAAIDLSGKFGILPAEAIALVKKVRSAAKTLGICFHVGSQCMEPSEYRHAITIAKEIVEEAKVHLDVLDVGGGFPSSYPGMTPPALKSYIDEINDSVKSLGLKDCELWCEPGRALVAESGSLIVRVEARKQQMLYINDGTYGGLFDAGYPGFIYPTKAIRHSEQSILSGNLIAFGFYGPTCDSLDYMKGPFYLPENIKEGDYIEIGGLGAYSKSIRTTFNGFDEVLQIEVADRPLVSMYEEKEEPALQSEFLF